MPTGYKAPFFWYFKRAKTRHPKLFHIWPLGLGLFPDSANIRPGRQNCGLNKQDTTDISSPKLPKNIVAKYYVISVDTAETSYFINRNYALVYVSILISISIYFLSSSQKEILLLKVRFSNVLIGVFIEQGVKQKYF